MVIVMYSYRGYYLCPYSLLGREPVPVLLAESGRQERLLGAAGGQLLAAAVGRLAVAVGKRAGAAGRQAEAGGRRAGVAAEAGGRQAVAAGVGLDLGVCFGWGDGHYPNLNNPCLYFYLFN